MVQPKSALTRIAFITAACFACLAYGTRPETVFRTIDTDHFEIIYQQEQKDLAKRYAVAAEQARELLMPIFKEGPDKTIVFINDDTDFTNGMANFLPYPMISVYPVLPSTLDSIDDFGDWPLEMMVHEYTHILNMYPAHGFYVPLKPIFGSLVRPNAILPKWYLEGLAVDTESRLTDHGRLRAPETQAEARTLVIGGNLQNEDIAVINEQGISTWPYGARPYLFGGWWWNEVQSKKGQQVIETWNGNFSRRIPFMLNGPMREQTGKSAVELLDATYAGLTRQAETELKALRGSAPHRSQPVVDESGEQNIFAVSPNGEKLVYLLSHPLVFLGGGALMGTEVMLKTRAAPTQPFREAPSKRLFRSNGSLRMRWIDDTRLIFEQVDVDAVYVNYHDLYSYDLNSEKITRLTKGLRAQEPAPSPKHDKVAFIQNDGGHNILSLLPLQNELITAAPKVLVRGNFQQRLSGPEFINDGEIVFAMRARSGEEKLFVYNLTDNSLKPWNTQLKSAQNARLTAKGLLVSDDSTHVRNIYLAGAGNAVPQAVSNTLTHIESADYDPKRNELLFSEMTSQGNRLQSIPFSTFKPASIEPVKIPPPPVPTTNKIKVSDGSYQPISYLFPHYWIPFAYNVENGWLFQGITSNSDPAGRNSYSIVGSIDTITNKPSYGIDYLNRSLPTEIGLGYGKSISYLTASNITLESQTAGLSFYNRWPFNTRSTRWNLGGSWNETTGTMTFRRIGPSAGIAYSRTQIPNSRWAGVSAELSHQEFLKQSDYLAYGRTSAHLAGTRPIFGSHKIFLQARAAMAPKLAPDAAVIQLGDRNVGGNYLVNLANSQFLLRGYPSGTFVGRKIINGNIEYSLPVGELSKGLGTFPIFLRNIELAIFADAMSVDGGGLRPDDGRYHAIDLSHYFVGTGSELRLATTMAYQMPVTFIVGAYYGLNQQYGGGFSPFLGLGIGDLGAVQNKTP